MSETMSDITPDHQPQSYTIFCVILGETTPFSVKIASNETVDQLKKKIKEEKKPELDHIAADKLTLYRLDISGSEEAITERLKKDGGRLGQLEKLNPLHELTKIYSTAPPKETIHILVQHPQKGPPNFPSASEKHGRSEDDGDSEPASKRKKRHSPPVGQIYDSITRRSSTVDALYQRLAKYHFIMVRGTPGSGKSTLAQLLERYIRANEPTVDPIAINSWARDGTDWRKKLTPNYIDGGRNTIIIDEAQLTYWDDGFWNGFLKQITPQHPSRVILFVSYGSPTARVSVVGTPMFVPDCNRVSLRPVDYQDELPAAPGILLPADEFFEMVKTVYSAGRFTTDFLDYVLGLTSGHVGAVIDLLRIVMEHDSYRRLKHEAGEWKYSLEIFRRQIPINDLWKRLDSSGVFRRGLPLLAELQEQPVARVFRKVLSNNNVTKQMLDTNEDQDALDRCFNEGWLHATTDQEKTLYIFTTPLHQWFVEYYLGTSGPEDPTLITDQNLRTFAIEVMKRFSPRQLSSPRKIGASNLQRPPEAQFQDEFYRCCHEYSEGSLISFPEYGGASGRIDFYIPLKKWGVELLRDGDRLENHSSRFIGSGSYAKMQLEDYIILDFRTTRPQKTHPGIVNLYHVVFENDFKQIEIQEGLSLQTVESFALLNYN